MRVFVIQSSHDTWDLKAVVLPDHPKGSVLGRSACEPFSAGLTCGHAIDDTHHPNLSSTSVHRPEFARSRGYEDVGVEGHPLTHTSLAELSYSFTILFVLRFFFKLYNRETTLSNLNFEEDYSVIMFTKVLNIIKVLSNVMIFFFKLEWILLFHVISSNSCLQDVFVPGHQFMIVSSLSRLNKNVWWWQ